MNSKRGGKPFPFALMQEKPEALDRLDLQFRWGGYGIRVLKCHLTSFEPGKIIRYHKHSEYEFHFIPRGKGTVLIEGNEYELSEGSFYLTGPGVLHQQESSWDDPMYELCLHVDISLLTGDSVAGWDDEPERNEAGMCIESLDQLPLRPLNDQFNAMGQFLVAYRAWQEAQFGSFTTIKQAIIQIMLRSARTIHRHSAALPLPARNLNAHRFQLAVQFIQDNYASMITLNEVADKVQISGRQLQRIFQEHHSLTFSEFLEDYRLSRVCASLAEGKLSIEQIAAEHGFTTSSYLYAVFKKKYGLTPGQYRHSYANRH